MNVKEKRGISPVIATVLLVSIVVVLAIIIFLWARQFVGDAIQKDGQAVELLCEDVTFEAEAYAGTLYVENTGSVPIHGMEIRDQGFFGDVTSREEFDGVYIGPGETGSVDLPADIGSGTTILVVPMLLGEVEGQTKKKAYICDKDYGEQIEVGA